MNKNVYTNFSSLLSYLRLSNYSMRFLVMIFHSALFFAFRIVFVGFQMGVGGQLYRRHVIIILSSILQRLP